jgi:hypothetical protein
MQHKTVARTVLTILILSAFVVPVAAQTVADPGAEIEQFFTDVEGIMLAVATSAAVIGFIGLAIMYLGSSFPLIATWKAENPKASSQVVIGLLLLIFIGGGSLTAFLSF